MKDDEEDAERGSASDDAQLEGHGKHIASANHVNNYIGLFQNPNNNNNNNTSENHVEMKKEKNELE